MNTVPLQTISQHAVFDPALPDIPEMDSARFDELMAIAGPDMAEELLRRLRQDLESTQDRLTAAVVPPDWAAVRAQTHILLALAGAVGAIRLQHMAQSLHVLAQTEQPGGLDRLVPNLLEQLAQLIDFVSGRLAGMGE